MSRMLFEYNDILVEEQHQSHFGETQAQKDLEEFKETLIEVFNNDDAVFQQRTRESLERVESREIKRKSLKKSNPIRLADSFKELVDICDYSEPTDAVELKQLARERRL